MHSVCAICPPAVHQLPPIPAGILVSAWNPKGKPYPRVPPIMGPWWDIDFDVRLGGYTNISDVALINWPKQDDCGCRNFAVAANPSGRNLNPTGFISSALLSNVDPNTLWHIPPSDPGKVNHEDCVDFVCTGLNNTLLVDEDGSLTGNNGGASLLPFDPQLVVDDTRAVAMPDMLSYVVPGGQYRYNTTCFPVTPNILTCRWHVPKFSEFCCILEKEVTFISMHSSVQQIFCAAK